MSHTDPNDVLMSGGVPSAKFEAIGDSITGEIVSTELRQQRDYVTQDVLMWDDGTPKMQIRVVLATGQRDGEDDDGQRALWCKSAMLTAVRTAVRKAGARRLEEGGRLTVTHTGVGEPRQRGMQGAKLYAANYMPPAPGVNVESAQLDDSPEGDDPFERF